MGGISIFILVFLLFFYLIPNGFISAQTCEVTEVKSTLKKALYDYLPDPKSSNLDKNEIKDLLDFYLDSNLGTSNLTTIECSTSGGFSGKTYDNIVSNLVNLTFNVSLLACSDGTFYSDCSSTLPKYCFDGKLVNRCDLCGCPAGGVCEEDLSCTISSSCGDIVQISTGGNSHTPFIYDDKIVWHGGGIHMYDLTTKEETIIGSGVYPKIYGDKIVWQDERKGNADIYMYDLTTGQEIEITTALGRQEYPNIYENIIVWGDYRNGNSDIYMYNLSNESEARITSNTEYQGWPSVHGKYIVWLDLRNGNWDVYAYDLSTKKEIQVTNDSTDQYAWDIYDNKVVWAGGGGRIVYDFSTGQRTQIGSGGGERLNINGDKVVWNENNDVFMYDLTTEQETQITTNTAAQTDADIYEDKIVWHDLRTGQLNIFMTTLCPA